MSDEWSEQLKRVHAWHKQADFSSAYDKRVAMCDLVMLCRRAPESLLMAHRKAQVSDIQNSADEFESALATGKLTWRATGSDRELALTLAGLLRAIDANLIRTPEMLSAPSHADATLVSKHDCYVIPRIEPKLPNRPGPGNSFGRNGTPHFRILPRKIGANRDYNVVPIWKPRLRLGPLAQQTRECIAALFPGLTVEFDSERKDYLAVSAGGAEYDAQLLEQINAAFAQDTLAAVWPELCVPPDRLERLRGELEKRALPLDPARGPKLVAAGSWHVGEEGARHSRMPVLDRFGSLILHYNKSIPFDVDGKAEAIVGDRDLPILVTPDALVGFAICGDFSELELLLPYVSLDLDLVLVASLANPRTMQGHESNAAKLGSIWGTRVLVSQQLDSPGEHAGFVFPAEVKGADCKTNSAVNLRSISFT